MRSWKKLIRRKVIVNLKDGSAVAGVLFEQSGPILILKAASYYEPNATEGGKLDGETVIPIENVHFIQLPSSEG